MAIILSGGEGPLSPYANGLIDRSYAAHDESIFGHLVAEKGYPLKDALEDLAPQVKQAYRTTELAKQWLPILGGGTLLAAVGVGVGVGVGFGLAPALPAIAALFLWNQTIDEWKVRSAEYQLHKKIFPNIPSLMFALSQSGATAEELIGAYDGLVQAIGNRIMSNQEISAADVRSFLEGKILEYRSNGNVFEEMEDLSMGTVANLDPSIAVMISPSTAQTELQPIAAAPSMSVVNGVEPMAQAAEPNYLARIWQIIDRNKNFFVGGQPGSGKGVMVSNLIRRKLDQHPGSIAVWLDPKGSPREDGNFKDPRITRLKMNGVGMSRAEYAIEVAEILETARSFVKKCDIENGKRVWIVFDEIMNLKQKLSKDLFGEVQDLLVDCVTMGDDQGLHTVALTQSFNAGDTVGSDEILKNLALIACFKEDDFPRAKKLVQYGKTNHESYSVEEFSRLVRKSPRDRVICIGGTFIPAPEMPLLSGWDRDKGAKTTSQAPKAATFQTIAVQEDPDDFENLPDFFKAMAIIALNTQAASDRSIIANDLTHAQNAAKAMKAAADNGDATAFEENKTILTDRIHRLKNNA